MIAFPNCKINLGLNILRKRSDNYHDIETVFYPLDFTDALEIIANNDNSIDFTVTGLPVGDEENNLCIKAYHLLRKYYPRLPFIKMHLHKAIPPGAGLAGGSSDAAFTLKLLKDKFLKELTTAQLSSYALQLGSDCPFFLYNKLCLATGRGELLQPLNLDLSAYKLMLVNPAIHIDTSWAFSKIKPSPARSSISKIILQPVESWKQVLTNDFEITVFERYPEIKNIKETLYRSGALYASLSGTGSTVYGIFDKSAQPAATFPNGYFTRVFNLK